MAQDFLRNTNRTVSWLKTRSDAGELEIAPPFQRNPVWLTPQKSLLIDTILQGYPVPELYIQELVDEEGKERFIVVDGQQRVRTCLEFIEGQFEIRSQDSGDWPDMSFDDLSSEDRRRLFGYNFVVRILPDLSRDILSTIFQRLNRNTIALNQQELRHSTYWGKFIQVIDTISDNPIWINFGIFSANDIRRMLDREFVSEIAVASLHGIQNKKQSIDSWYRTYEDEFDDSDRLLELFAEVLGELRQVLPNVKLLRWRKKSDFYTLFLVFATHIEALPLTKEVGSWQQPDLTSSAMRLTLCFPLDRALPKVRQMRMTKSSWTSRWSI